MSRSSTITAQEIILKADYARPVHLIQNQDLYVLPARGTKGEGWSGGPTAAGLDDLGMVVISLGADGGGEIENGIDEVHVQTGFGLETVDVLEHAIAALERNRGGLRRLAKA
jgi:hypothetical protein